MPAEPLPFPHATPSTGQYVDFLDMSIGLNQDEKNILRGLDVRGPEELYSLVSSFPSLFQVGVDISKLSSAGLSASSAGFKRIATAADAVARRRSGATRMGASYTTNSPTPPGTVAALPMLTQPQAPLGAQNLDVRIPNGWNVRNQGDRPTCVAFAKTAFCEAAEYKKHQVYQAFSEQFTYWAAKEVEGASVNLPGTTLAFAHKGVETYGLCEDFEWPYSPHSLPNDETHGSPSSVVQNRALLRRRQNGKCWNGILGGANAQMVYDALAGSTLPVPVSLPVFIDQITNENNWYTSYTLLSGKVFNPPPSSIAYSVGHAVCITGFLVDLNEPLGGHFIFRNSWGQGWASDAPNWPDGSPEPGYGVISASYVNQHLWEMYCE